MVTCQNINYPLQHSHHFSPSPPKSCPPLKSLPLASYCTAPTIALINRLNYPTMFASFPLLLQPPNVHTHT